MRNIRSSPTIAAATVQDSRQRPSHRRSTTTATTSSAMHVTVSAR
ncbi:MAG TPA: hypothetical protein VF318_03670 [Dehalococcoidales bacterium]